jgi:hypothetical protein
MIVSFAAYEDLTRLRLAKQGESRRDWTGVAFKERPQLDWPVDSDCGT